MSSREPITKEVREQVHQKTDGHCAYCGDELKKGWHVDHVIPVAAGGPDDIMNFLPACAKCNNYKTSMSLKQFRRELQMQVQRARKYSVNFRLAEKYKQITVHETPIVFYFETLGQVFDESIVWEWIRASRNGQFTEES